MNYEEIDKLTSAQEKVRLRLEHRYAGLGMFLFPFRPYAGKLLMNTRVERSMEVVKYCRHSKRLWNILESLLSNSDLAALIIGHGSLLLAIFIQSGKSRFDPKMLEMFGLSEAQVFATEADPPNSAHFDFQAQEKMNADTAYAAYFSTAAHAAANGYTGSHAE